MKNKKILWTTRTAALIALLVVTQYLTSMISGPFQQYITGSAVNLILIAATMTGGIYCGGCVAILSPCFAFLLGIPKVLPLVPFIMLGNLILVLVWHLMFIKAPQGKAQTYLRYILSTAIAGIAKFAVLYLGVVKVSIPLFLNAKPDAMKNTLAATFSFPQLFTAIMGGILAILIIPIIKKAVSNKQ